jgi:hypothetical protein
MHIVVVLLRGIWVEVCRLRRPIARVDLREGSAGDEKLEPVSILSGQ